MRHFRRVKRRGCGRAAGNEVLIHYVDCCPVKVCNDRVLSRVGRKKHKLESAWTGCSGASERRAGGRRVRLRALLADLGYPACFDGLVLAVEFVRGRCPRCLPDLRPHANLSARTAGGVGVRTNGGYGAQRIDRLFIVVFRAAKEGAWSSTRALV